MIKEVENVKEMVEKLFFTYKRGEINKYSEASILHAGYYILEYDQFLKRKPKAFITLLEEMPLHAFAYYLSQLYIMDDEYIDEFPTLVHKRESLHIHDLAIKVKEWLKKEDYVTSAIPIGETAVVVSVKKQQMKYNNSHDFLLHMSHNGVSITELMSEFREDVRKKDRNFEKHKELLRDSLHIFQQQNKLRLFFIS